MYQQNILLNFLLILLLIASKSYAKVVSCEGFVKTDLRLIDFTQIQVKLFTSNGNLKYETECDAQNGYFLIPIYNRGKYEIRIAGSQGWVFEPDRQLIQISDNGGCEDDIIFRHTGFEVTGEIINDGGQGQPLFLGLYDAGGNLIEQTHTDGGSGHYKFQAKPGKYIISTMSGAAQCVQRGSVSVEVKNAPVRVVPDIKIAGHNLKVSVIDEWGKRVGEAVVNLYSQNQLKLEDFPLNTKKPKSHEAKGGGWIYSFESLPGEFVLFPCLPAATYHLDAVLKKSNLEILFERKTFHLDQQTSEIVLGVVGFNVFGVLLSPSNKPVSGVLIYLDGSKKVATSSDGTFILTGLEKGKHRIGAEKEHFEFESMEVDLSSRLDVAIKLRTKRLAFCGIVAPTPIDGAPSLEIVQIDGNRLIETLKPNKDGHFCRLLNPAEYIVRVSSVVSYSPPQIHLNLAENPVVGIKFSQFKAKIIGKVDYFGANLNGIHVELFRDESLVAKSQLVENGEFEFIDVSPSLYRVCIIDNQNIWWDSTEKVVEIVDKDVVDVTFTQKGYKLQIQSSHPATLIFFATKSSNVAMEKIELIKGLNTIYFMKSNRFNYTIDSCHEFETEGTDQNTFSVPSMGTITFTALHTIVPFSLKLVEDDPTSRLIFREKTTDTEISEYELSDSDNVKTFVFRLNQNEVGKEFSVTPYSTRHLFVPEHIQFTFDGNCRDEKVDFKAQVGNFIDGKVVPSLSEVQVSAIKRDANEVRLSAETDDNGKYRIGPVWETRDWIVEMAKDGYEFIRDETNPFEFTAIKSSQLIVRFVDNNSQKSLAEVLVSVSANSSDFRSNSITDQSGILSFVGLAPDTYFIRPILQEYKFVTNSLAVEIKEGQTQELTLRATRFAYSIFGKVSPIGSRSLRMPVHVEALSPNCENHQEEDVVDPQTNGFRIRGLKPTCRYNVLLKGEDDKRIKAFPPMFNVQSGHQDKLGANFVMLPDELPDPTLVGELEVHGNATYGKYRVVLAENGNALQEKIVQGSVFWFILPGYNRHYSISIDRNEAKRMKIEPVSAEFFAGSPFNFIRLHTEAEQRSIEIDVNKSNYIGLALIILTTIAFLNQSKTKLLMETIIGSFRASAHSKLGINAELLDALRRKRPKRQ